MDTILIRKMTKNDGAAIREIMSSIEQHATEIDYVGIAEELTVRTDAVCYTAEVDGAVAGFMISYILSGVYGIEKSAWIATLGVHPKFMGRGIGNRLAEETFGTHRKKGIQNIFTTVRWDSTDLLSYFKTLGFDRSSYINLEKVLDK